MSVTCALLHSLPLLSGLKVQETLSSSNTPSLLTIPSEVMVRGLKFSVNHNIKHQPIFVLTLGEIRKAVFPN